VSVPPPDRNAGRTVELFGELVDLPVDARRARLAEVACGDGALALTLAQLLVAFEENRTPTANLTDLFAALGDAADAPEPAAGDTLGGFELVSKLGEGGMGEVWIATQSSPSRRVALKLVRARSRGLAVLAGVREREALAAVRHPGIATIFAAGEERGIAWIAMELVDDAQDLVTAARGLPLRDRIALVADVADALAHAHASGFIHRDIKPSNVLVGSDGRPKVIDFGIATASGAEGDPLAYLGTPAYLAPESVDRACPSASVDAGNRPRLSRARAVDARADVRALGILLHQCVHGRLPEDLAQGSPAEVLARLASARITPPADAAPQTRGDLAAIVRHATAADPAARYPTMSAFAEDLRAFLARRPLRAAPRGASGRAFLAMRRHPFAAGALALAVLALFAATVTSLWYAHRAQRAAEQANLFASDIESIYMTFREVVLPSGLAAEDVRAKTVAEHMRDRVARLEELSAHFATPGHLRGLEETASSLQYACIALGLAEEARRCAIAREFAAVRLGDRAGGAPLGRLYDEALSRLAIEPDDPAAIASVESILPRMMAEHDIVSSAALFRIASADHLGSIVLSRRVAEGILRTNPRDPDVVQSAASRLYLVAIDAIARWEPLDAALASAVDRANSLLRMLVDGNDPVVRAQAKLVAASVDFHFARMLAVARTPELIPQFVEVARLGAPVGRLGAMETIGLRLLRAGEFEAWRAVLSEIDRPEVELETAAALPIERARAELVLLDASADLLSAPEQSIARARGILHAASLRPPSNGTGEIFDRLAVFERLGQLALETGDVDAVLADVARLRMLAATAEADGDPWAAERYAATASQLADMLEVGNWVTE